MEHIVGSADVFAAIKSNGFVVAWGGREFGGDTSELQEALASVVRYFVANRAVFAVRNSKDCVVTCAKSLPRDMLLLW